MKNQVIKVLNLEHGEKVIQYWKNRGVDTRQHMGSKTEDTRCSYIYYGVIDGKFNNYDLDMVNYHNAEIIELPNGALPIPRMVLVCDYENEDIENWYERELLADLSEFGIDFPYICRCSDIDDDVNEWKYMKEIPQVEEMTLEQVCKELGRKIKIIE